ncbi:c-type cytochrome [Dongia rigui]|uniref:C-type cytochrome n=1 Tax=Dongia rigui TaxID=940149 RepID=A0ABU5DXM4_9PROT|nr:c-type cytochrome [Dongia rigui]MDY0871670.1 c-type cytochrome [Dongia rigui]
MKRAFLAAILFLFMALQAPSAEAAGNPARGAALYAEDCSACHAADTDQRGPHHRGLFSRQAGSVPGFDYSDALRGAGFIWSDQLLDAWLADPEALLPGQDMNVSVEDAQDRADLIAYLKTLQP